MALRARTARTEAAIITSLSWDHTRYLGDSLEAIALEKLAMAAEARGQSSYGHVARVQAYSVGLATLVGVNDATIDAIRTAALLHDVGKLAVPDYILNKPGALTPPESSRLKMYPRIGADILSRINFPVPVAPIVACHRENWDGSGYPEGLAGNDLPLGARILNLAEAFDAMRSPPSILTASTCVLRWQVRFGVRRARS
jgi:putative nucleotidyltransferase with HDIG domain